MNTSKDIGHLRKSYEKGDLSDALKATSPIRLFEEWFAAAEANPAIEEANAMSIVTLGEDDFPKARIVLLSSLVQKALFFTPIITAEKGNLFWLILKLD